MGIKELDHLKKSLSKIKTESSQLRAEEKRQNFLLKESNSIDNRIDMLESDIKRIRNNIMNRENDLSNCLGITEEELKELYNIENKIKKIELSNKGKVRKKRDLDIESYSWKIIKISIIFYLLPFFLTVFLGNGWMTLAISGEDGRFECANGEIVPAYYVNDGHNDCGDNSDEDVYVTEELKAAIEKSEEDSGLAFGAYCCVLPLLMIGFMTILFDKVLEPRYIRMNLISKDDLNTVRNLEKNKEHYNEIQDRKINLEIEIGSQKVTLFTSENSLTEVKIELAEVNSKIIANKLEINNLKGSIEETYESIKHLIPYSEYL